ncbi:nucleoside-diphosphate-sugar epimerase [Aquimarina sp. EL_43]|uniref:SDR family NAD(P)-dependent oxidoreductase n=1 Tax=unclassified Aquimarina TaxID=2627091 RepID=UPI0018CA18DC|nr:MULTISPECIES: SDR family NAD(P)-dependent oxidoreductase [unclassified Aquimarina]MBG6130246.1 nucleoside-diphosphate-sugar epimerase [Aquimarina sp. EL_35]MBG6149026.1 nucleoside-diphosphate-sugar epimerase [Aquimarina sp. EL_32]MBG6168600.1 nucleoside-diphosphate-sugar epimerase [Aquimarina sp. EL_43]
MKKSKHISILGCGWLGLPLAINRIANEDTVKGSTTTESKIEKLKSEGITPYLFTLGKSSEKEYLDFLSGSEIVIINFPPKRIPNIIEIYQNQIKSILPSISDTQKIIFISSTSVYQNTNAEVTETLNIAPEKESGKAVAAVERLLQEQFENRVSIIRLSGLIGDDRLPGRFLANKKEVQNGDVPINVIHREDCIGLINAVIEKEAWGEIINGCADQHPIRKEYYTLAAQKIGLTPPTFIKQEKQAYKIISNTKSKTLLGYSYIHPDPLKLI